MWRGCEAVGYWFHRQCRRDRWQYIPAHAPARKIESITQTDSRGTCLTVINSVLAPSIPKTATTCPVATVPSICRRVSGLLGEPRSAGDGTAVGRHGEGRCRLKIYWCDLLRCEQFKDLYEIRNIRNDMLTSGASENRFSELQAPTRPASGAYAARG